MKVALINDRLNAGGAEKVLVNMANLMHRKGVDVLVVLYLKPAILDQLLHPSIPVFYLERKGRFDIGAMRALKKIVQKTDIIHVHSRYNLRYLMCAKLLTGFSKPKIFFHEHVPVLSVNWITRLCLKKADGYIAVLKTMSEWAVKELRLSPAKVFYLPNTVNAPDTEIASAPAGGKIAMVGNFWHFKNQAFAIELIKALPAGFSLDMYGTINDKEYHKALLSLISSYQLENRIRLIEGVSNIYSVIGNYNFAIHTSPHETGPLVLLEYMHAGLPFLTFKTGDVVANIYNELPEAVIDSFEVEDWKKKIEDVMMNEDARGKMKLKMKTVIEKHYTEDSYWQKLNNIYQSNLIKKANLIQMKLGVISDCIHYKMPNGTVGTENHIYLRQLQALCSFYSDTLICCPFAAYDPSKVISVYTDKNIQFTPVPVVGGDNLKAKLTLLAAFAKWRQAYKKIDRFSDVVYQRFPNNLNIPAFFYFRLRRKKTFATYTGTWDAYPSEPKTYRFQRWLLNNYFKGPLWVYSNQPTGNKRIHPGFSPSYSAAEWDEETLQVQKRIERIKEEGIPVFRLITVGTLISYKNQAGIVRSCLLLKKQGFPFSLTIVGDGPMRNELENLVAASGLQNEVKLVGKKKYAELRELYRQNDFVVQAPFSEGFGKVPVEGFFHGVIPVINNISMAKFMTGDEERGFLFDASNEMNLAETLIRIKTLTSKLPGMIEKGRQFSKGQTLEQWATEYYKTVTDYFGNP